MCAVRDLIYFEQTILSTIIRLRLNAMGNPYRILNQTLKMHYNKL